MENEVKRCGPVRGNHFAKGQRNPDFESVLRVEEGDPCPFPYNFSNEYCSQLEHRQPKCSDLSNIPPTTTP